MTQHQPIQLIFVIFNRIYDNNYANHYHRHHHYYHHDQLTKIMHLINTNVEVSLTILCDGAV